MAMAAVPLTGCRRPVVCLLLFSVHGYGSSTVDWVPQTSGVFIVHCFLCMDIAMLGPSLLNSAVSHGLLPAFSRDYLHGRITSQNGKLTY